MLIRRDLSSTVLHVEYDFSDDWVALLIAVLGTLYRLFGRPPEPEAFPMLSYLWVLQ